MKKRIWYLHGCLLLAATFMLLSTAAFDEIGTVMAAPGVPRAEFQNVKYVWKTAIEGEKVKHTFTVRNGGTAELIIEQVKTS